MSFSGCNDRGERRPVLHIGDPRLRQVAAEVERADINGAEVQELIDDLVATMRGAGGAGLAATQIGVQRRVCVIEVDNNPRYPYKPPIPLTVLVNPVVRSVTDEQFVNNEGCLSVPGMRGEVARHTRIRVDAFDRSGAELGFDVGGLSAGTFQHECDHLDGLLFVDKLVDPASLSTWDNFERFHRQGYLERVAEIVDRFGQ